MMIDVNGELRSMSAEHIHRRHFSVYLAAHTDVTAVHAAPSLL
jgi:hypothetical protein